MIRTVKDEVALHRVAILLALAVFCLYLPTLFQGFIADDNIYLAFTNHLLRDTGWSDWYRPLLERANPWEYLPLRDFSYWLDFRLYKVEGEGFHLTNLIWYALSATGAGLLFRELVLLFHPEWTTRASTLAWCGVAVFIVHPVHVEAAAWVASRKDLMSGAFAFLSVFTLAHGIRCRWSPRYMVLAALLLLMSCFSKAAGMTMVLFETALILAARHSMPGVGVARKALPMLLLWGTAALAAIVHMKTGATTGVRIENVLAFPEVIERASRIIAALMHLLFFPDMLGFYHDVYAQGSWHWLISGIVMLTTVIALRALLIRPALWSLGVLLVCTPWAVYLQLLPFTTWSLASERFVFMSVAGLSLIVMELCGRLSPRRSMALLLAIALPCAVRTWHRVEEWELTAPLRQLEYTHQPHFHNAIRDRIVYLLLPQQKYTEAEQLIGDIGRPYAADALRALIAVDQANQALNENRNTDPARFCRALTSLQQTLDMGRVAMRNEPDVSYNNLLQSLDREIWQRYSGNARRCAERNDSQDTLR